jgi:hypothetical protein
MSTTMDEAVARVNQSRERLDRFVDAKAAMEHRQWREQERARADALDEERTAELEQARKHGEACVRHQSRYDSAYRGLGLSGAPPRNDGEYPGDYRRRLLGGVRDKLSPSHPFANVDFDDLDTPAIKAIEPQILEAAEREAQNPSPENLPADGSLVQRDSVGPMGSRTTTFFGRRSFIADMGRPGRKVLRIIDPNDGRVLWGRPWSLPPT